MDKLNMQTANVADENFLKLAALFPNAVTETINENGEVVRAIDKDVLMQEINTQVVEGREERYQFTWPDKRKAVIAANAPTNNTLRPCREESVDFDSTENLYIEGDNLEVLKLLQESYLGKVKMIYIDPPYNTGNDFVYEDDFAESTEDYKPRSFMYDEDGMQIVDASDKNTSANGRFHTDWLNLVFPRLNVARNLLSSEGVIFISIDDREIENLRKCCNDVFGESNFIASFIVIRSEGGGLAKRAVIGHDYLIAYAKDINVFPNLGRPKDIRGKIVSKDGEDYWIETDWFREEFGRYGTCHYEDILIWYDEKKKAEIDLGLKNGNYVLIPKNGKHIIGRYRKVADDTSKFYTILKHLNKNGVDDLSKLRLEKFFDFPKPISLLKEIILGSTIRSKNCNDVVLDFFSGSATTAHAVMQLNAEDGGNRKFIMVQLPEETDEKSEARKAGYKNICEIGKERIRRAAKKIREEHPDANFDGGFRVLKLDTSNMQQVYYTPEEYVAGDLFANTVDNIKEDRTAEDLLFQAMLELDVPLSAKITTCTIGGKEVFNVSDGYIMACFDKGLTDEVIADIAKRKPYYFVMRDSGMADDSVAVNFEQLFKSYSPETILKVF